MINEGGRPSGASINAAFPAAGKPYNRAAPVGNSPLSPPAAVLPPEGEVLAALSKERLKLALREVESKPPPPGEVP